MKFKKNFFSRTTEPISTKLGRKHPWVKEIPVCLNEFKGPALFQGEIYEIVKYINKIKKSSYPEPLGHFQPNLAQNMLG